MSDDDSEKRGLPFQEGHDPRRSTGNPDYHFEEGNTHAVKTGLFTSLENIPESDRQAIIEQGLSYEEAFQERLGREPDSIESKDLWLLAKMDWRIAKANDYVIANIDDYLSEDKISVEKLKDVEKERRELRNDLGLNQESPQSRKADAQSGFFEAMSEDSSSKDE